MGSATTQQVGVAWGVSSDKTVPGDYDGDGKTDFSVYRADNPATSENECASGCNWYIQNSSKGASTAYNFGLNTDELAPADYDGDGRTDPAVFRNGSWFILKSSDAGMLTVSFGAAGDKPVAADYDGDGKADQAVWREGTSPNSANFYILRSSSNQFQSQQFGTMGAFPCRQITTATAKSILRCGAARNRHRAQETSADGISVKAAKSARHKNSDKKRGVPRATSPFPLFTEDKCRIGILRKEKG